MIKWSDYLLIFLLYLNNFIILTGNNTLFLMDFIPLIIGLLLRGKINFFNILFILLTIVFINSLFFHSLLFFPLYFLVIILSYLIIDTVSIYNPNYKYLFFFGIVFSAMVFKLLFVHLVTAASIYRQWAAIGINTVLNIFIIWRLKDDKFKFAD